jgi:hypothetical protein
MSGPAVVVCYVATGCILAIPHNGNLSNGLMFRPETLDGLAITRRWDRMAVATSSGGI